MLDLLGGGRYGAGGLLHYHLLIRSGGNDDTRTAVIVGGREEVEARLSVFGMDAEEIYESVCEQIREDTLIPLTAYLAPKVGTLLAELGREVDEEWDLYGSGDKGMAHQLEIVFVEERIAVVGEVDDEGVLLAVVLYDLVDDVIGVEEAIHIARDDLILPFILALVQTIGRSERSSYKESR